MNTFGKIACVTAAVAGMALSTSDAMARGGVHPRRLEVNTRLAHQNYRIDRGLEKGQITQTQANQLHQDDRSIRSEERTEAGLDGGHITRADQRSLNQQENTVSGQIHADRHP